MGANAARRREQKAAAHPRGHCRIAGRRSTKTTERLRAAAAQITTLAQFEECVARAHPDNQGGIRKLLGDMLTPNLPCCGAFLLAIKVGRSAFSHSPSCPSRKLVQL